MITDDKGRVVNTTRDAQVVEAIFPENRQRAGALKARRGRKTRRGRKVCTTIYLRRDQLDWLNQTADRHGVSVASIVRGAIDDAVQRYSDPLQEGKL